MLDDKRLPNGIGSGRFRNHDEHALDPRQLGCGRRRKHSQAVLVHRPRGDHPQFHKVLRDHMELCALLGENFKSADGHFVLRMPNLQRTKECASVHEHVNQTRS